MATTLLFGSINDSRELPYEPTPKPAIKYAEFPAQFPYNTPNLISSFITWSTFWFALLCLFILLNHKHMPFMWHMRIVNAFRFVCRSQRPKVALGPSHIFQPLVMDSTAQLMEIDFNMHKTNSSYFADMDIARAHLVCTLFSEGIAYMRGGTGAITGSKQPMFGLALGAATCSFKKEVKPYEKYEMWSKVLAWDEKWIYIVTHFVRKDAAKPRSYTLYPQQNDGEAGSDGFSQLASGDVPPEKQLFATALSKCVFKSGRKTVAPELMLQMSGLLPVPPAPGGLADEKRSAEDVEETAQVLRDVESRRQKGLETARALAADSQQGLEAQFEGNDCEAALGRHTDGAGVVGVVSTLMQLAHLRQTQIL